ncbi:MAG: peptidylprolyl isomerase [Pseudomonadota bacterium]
MSLDKIKVAEINGEPVSLADVLRTMKASGTIDAVHKGLADTIAQRKALELGLAISTEDLQTAADNYRDANGLQKASDTMDWLEAQGRSVEEFEASLEFKLLSERLRNHIASDRKVAKRFRSEGAAFNAAELAQIVMFDEDEAILVARSVQGGAMEFYDAARQYSEDFDTRAAGGYVGWRSQRALPPDLADQILSSQPGEVLGPVPIGDVFALIKILAIRAPKLDDATRTHLRDAIFHEWMERQLWEADAKIEFD